jgi:hypothetical protein
MDDQTAQHVDRLEALLDNLLALHEQLLHIAEQKRQALQNADTGHMTRLCELENEKLQAISEQEKKRLECVAALTQRVVPDAGEPMRLRSLAEQLPEPNRGRLLAQRQQLRQRMEAVREQSSVARRATESLLNHVNGLVRTLTTLASHAATYDRDGEMASNQSAVSTLNVTA